MDTSDDSFFEELGISQDELLDRGLVKQVEPKELIVAHISDNGIEHLLTPEAAINWKKMRVAAAFDGIDIFIISGYRSIQKQKELIQNKLNMGYNINEVLKVLAPPSFSEHHTGKAIDISTTNIKALQEEFDQTPAFKWLTENSNRFYFKLSYPKNNSTGYIYEPWHWFFYQ